MALFLKSWQTKLRHFWRLATFWRDCSESVSGHANLDRHTSTSTWSRLARSARHWPTLNILQIRRSIYARWPHNCDGRVFIWFGTTTNRSRLINTSPVSTALVPYAGQQQESELFRAEDGRTA